MLRAEGIKPAKLKLTCTCCDKEFFREHSGMLQVCLYLIYLPILSARVSLAPQDYYFNFSFRVDQNYSWWFTPSPLVMCLPDRAHGVPLMEIGVMLALEGTVVILE